jgi:multiple sugar transport system substrate-binding protein
MMRRYFLAAAIVLLLVAGGGTSMFAAPAATITFWNGVGAPENVVLSKLVADFNATNKDNITVQETVLDWGTLYPKLLLDTKAGNAPDALLIQQSSLMQEESLGLLTDLSTMARDAGFVKSDFLPTAWDGTIVKGKQVAIPFDRSPIALYYNVKMFKEAGLDPANPPKNKAEFLGALQKLTKGSDQYGLGVSYSGGTPFRIWMSLVWQHKNGAILSPDLSKAAFNTPAGVEALQFMQDLVYKYKVVPQQEDDPDADFSKGIVAMDISGAWSMYDFNKVDGLDYMTTPLPVVFDQPAAWSDSHVMALPNTKNKANMAAGMKLLKYLSSRGLTWTTEAGHLPVRKDVLASSAFKGLTKSQAFATTLATARYYPSIVKKDEVFGREATSPLVVMMQTILLNKGSAQEAVAAAEKMVNEILARK